MGNLDLDALINELDATLHDLEVRDDPPTTRPPQPPPKEIPIQLEQLAQQQAQLKLQQQLIEAQTALLRQQQLNNTAAISQNQSSQQQQISQNGVHVPTRRLPPHPLPPRSHFEALPPQANLQYQQQQQQQEQPYRLHQQDHFTRQQQLQQQQDQFNAPHLQYHQRDHYMEHTNMQRTRTTSDSQSKVSAYSPASNGDLYSLLSGNSSMTPGIDGGGVFGTKDKSDSDTVTSSEKKKRGWFSSSTPKETPTKEPKDVVSMVGLLENAGF
ncbi:hypothetical protein BJ741DRAFT_620594 [Chytriomyces cf. hyalinus JEL632]|nr:hypothetical protein BJ741DRAFT_620594 [Chytriomyces cf. hyalinus JEL632]